MQTCAKELSSSRATSSIEKAGAEARVAAQAAASTERLQHQIGLIRDWGSRGSPSSSHKVDCPAKRCHSSTKRCCIQALYRKNWSRGRGARRHAGCNFHQATSTSNRVNSGLGPTRQHFIFAQGRMPSQVKKLRLSSKNLMVESHIPNPKLVSCLSDSDRLETQL